MHQFFESLYQDCIGVDRMSFRDFLRICKEKVYCGLVVVAFF